MAFQGQMNKKGFCVEAPNHYVSSRKETTIFLAGGISNCPNWQSPVSKQLVEFGLVVLNPRRENFPTNDPDSLKKQISWEYQHIHNADMVLFWFPFETLCPITLFELGVQSMKSTPIFVGVHPSYQRRSNIENQLKLARPEVKIVHTIQQLVKQITVWDVLSSIPF